MWDNVKEKIRGTEGYADFERLAGSGKEEIFLTGLRGSSCALLLAAYMDKEGTPLVIVAPDALSMRDMEMDLAAFGIEGAVSYPEDEILPYDYHEPDRDLVGEQMKALHSIREGRCRALVCTVRSFMKKVFKPALFGDLLLSFEKGGKYDMTDAIERIASIGYERHQIVEEKGQFAVRGGILDIFEVGGISPVRVEFEDEEIVSVREFDVETQRSERQIDSLAVRPAGHITFDEEGAGRLRAMLEKRSMGEEEKKRREMLLPADRFENGISFFGMEHYAPVVNEVGPVLDYFSSPPLIVLADYERTGVEAGLFREEIEKRYVDSREEGRIYPEPSLLYIEGASVKEIFGSWRRVCVSGLNRKADVALSALPVKEYRKKLDSLERDVIKASESGTQVFLFCYNEAQKRRMEEILEESSIYMDFPVGEVSGGFEWKEAGILFLSEGEIFGRYHRAYKSRKSRSRSLTYDPSYFKPGDFVVHVDHGIGRYMGMRVLDMGGGKTECLDIRYAGRDRLFIPVDRLKMVEKFTSADGFEPALAKLGSRKWEGERRKARKSAELVARDLVEIYAARESARGFSFGEDTMWQREMEAMFPYEETPHQIQSTEEVKADMENPELMDRLLCGDVGFGKTEVALRAAFKAVLSGKQCAFLVPTTVLAMQHYETLTARLSGFPVNISVLSRFVPRSRQKGILKEIEEGATDIVVGTHRLLSGDIRFNDLGLVIVDEEHRFGVKQKESFKKMKKSVDVLSMTATPIPRTLHMALSGIRDISVIDTPPRNRLPIRTEILPFDEKRIEEAVMRELDRGGQVFFVHNRVQSIGVIQGYLERLLPDRVKIVHAHGQMKEKELEKVMLDFMRGEYDVMVCTMIIEAGLDFPNVNTIIINHADRFGLAQLYQLRGRVGRSDRKAYAYLLVPEARSMTPEGMKRLKAISEFDYLGAGYRIALRDLEIRGAGNILGHKQSGHVNAVGLDLYSRMLKEEIMKQKGERVTERTEVEIKSPVDTYLDEEYIHDSEERMDIYRRLSRMEGLADLGELRDELRDRFGPVPGPARNLLKAVEVRIRAGAAGVAEIDMTGDSYDKVTFREGSGLGKESIGAIVEAFRDRVSFEAGGGFSIKLLKGSGNAGFPGAGDAEKPEGPMRDIETLLTIMELYDTKSSLTN